MCVRRQVADRSSERTEDESLNTLKIHPPDLKTFPRFILYTRWGRVGYQGLTGASTFPFTLHNRAKEKAVAEFQKKYREKTRNEWGTFFRPVHGKYTPVETGARQVQEPKREYDDSVLSKELHGLLDLICDEGGDVIS